MGGCISGDNMQMIYLWVRVRTVGAGPWSCFLVRHIALVLLFVSALDNTRTGEGKRAEAGRAVAEREPTVQDLP